MTNPLGEHVPDMQHFLQQAQAMQRNMLTVQQELTALRVEATVGHGAVRATVDGSTRLQRLDIAPEVADPSHTEHLAELVLAAIQAATRSAQEQIQQKLLPTIAHTLGDSMTSSWRNVTDRD